MKLFVTMLGAAALVAPASAFATSNGYYHVHGNITHVVCPVKRPPPASLRFPRGDIIRHVCPVGH